MNTLWFYPSQTSLAPIHRRQGMEGVVGLEGKPNQEPRFVVYTTASASSDCITTHPGLYMTARLALFLVYQQAIASQV